LADSVFFLRTAGVFAFLSTESLDLDWALELVFLLVVMIFQIQ